MRFSRAHTWDWDSWVVGDRVERFELPGFPGTAPFRSPSSHPMVCGCGLRFPSGEGRASFVCSLAIRMPSLKCLFRPFAHLVTGLFVLLLCGVRVCVCWVPASYWNATCRDALPCCGLSLYAADGVVYGTDGFVSVTSSLPAFSLS